MTPGIGSEKKIAELLELAQSPQVAEAQPVEAFLAMWSIKPGRLGCRSGDIWRMYVECGGSEMKPREFAKLLKRSGLRGLRREWSGRERGMRMFGVVSAGARAVKQWVQEHPEPPGFGEWYRAQFIPGRSE